MDGSVSSENLTLGNAYLFRVKRSDQIKERTIIWYNNKTLQTVNVKHIELYFVVYCVRIDIETNYILIDIIYQNHASTCSVSMTLYTSLHQ